jgi:hypothetical protein
MSDNNMSDNNMSDNNMSELNFDNLRQKYKNDVDKINLNMKKKYFEFNILNYKNPQQIQCLDDTYDILFKNKTNYVLSNLNVDFKYSDNIITDIIKLCKIIFSTKYFDDSDFKFVKSHNDLNYLNPKIGDNIIYNSIRKSIFQQSDFRADLYKFEERLKHIMRHYGKEDNKINFFEDEE